MIDKYVIIKIHAKLNIITHSCSAYRGTSQPFHKPIAQLSACSMQQEAPGRFLLSAEWEGAEPIMCVWGGGEEKKKEKEVSILAPITAEAAGITAKPEKGPHFSFSNR